METQNYFSVGDGIGIGVRSDGSPGGVGDSSGSIIGLGVGIMVGESVGDPVGEDVGDNVGVAVMGTPSITVGGPVKANIAGINSSPAAVVITIFLNIFPPRFWLSVA